MFWLAEDDCGAAQSAASRSLQSGLDLYLRLRGLQLGAHAKSGGHSSGCVGRGRRVSAWAGFSPIGPRNIRNQLLATTRDEKQQAKHRIPQFFSSLLEKSSFDLINNARLNDCPMSVETGPGGIQRDSVQNDRVPVEAFHV